MAHGHNDYGLNMAKQTIHGVTDLGELAAMLGSIATFDRRGDTIFLDDFEDNIDKWDITLSRAGAAIALSGDTARNGGFSCKITTGNVKNDQEQMARYFSYPVLSKIGFEAHFVLHEFLQSITLLMILDNGVNTLWSGLRYLPPTDILQYYSDAPGWAQLEAGLPLYPMLQCFNGFKIVADFVNGVYSRAIVGQHTYPMTQAIYETGTLITPNSLGILIQAATDENVSHDCYVDDVIVTQNEP